MQYLSDASSKTLQKNNFTFTRVAALMSMLCLLVPADYCRYSTSIYRNKLIAENTWCHF